MKVKMVLSDAASPVDCQPYEAIFPASADSEITISIPETLNLSIKILTVAAFRQIYLWIEQTGDLTDVGVQLLARWRDSPDFLRKLRTRSFQGLAYDSRRHVVANSTDVRNG